MQTVRRYVPILSSVFKSQHTFACFHRLHTIYIYIYISIHSGTHRIMRRRTTSSNKERPDLRQEESSEEEKDEEEENRKIMYEVTIPHGILIGEVWIEYGELVRGIKEDHVSKKVYVEANEGKSKGWVDRNGLTAAAVINKPL